MSRDVLIWYGPSNKRVDVLKEDTAYYIPLIQSLQQLLNNSSVMEEVQ